MSQRTVPAALLIIFLLAGGLSGHLLPAQEPFAGFPPVDDEAVEAVEPVEADEGVFPAPEEMAFPAPDADFADDFDAAAPEEADIPVPLDEITLPSTFEYRGFWYDLVTDDDKGTTSVHRLDMPGDEYEERRRMEIETIWLPRYTAFLGGNFAFADADGIPPDMAQRMVALDPDTSARMAQDPAYQGQVARRMAEWTVFYEQLRLWRIFVETDVLQQRLSEEDLPTYDPTAIRAEMPGVYERMQERAREISQRQAEMYRKVIESVQEKVLDQRNYEAWLEEREDAMFRFAENWRRQYDGSQVMLDDTIFLVRTPQEVREIADEIDERFETLPPNMMVIEVPRERLVTPFDLLNADGTVKRPPPR